MKTTKLPAALAALLIPSLLFADTVEVTFDAALTNETGWVYSDKILSSTEGGEHPYFRTIGSYIESQQFSFNVTSITIRLSCSSTNATRHLQIGPTSDIGQQTTDVAENNKQESQTFLFDAASNMRSFLISLIGIGTTGNWHVYSATISGVPIVPPPSGLHAGYVGCNRFTLSWENPEAAVSNRIDVCSVTGAAAGGTTERRYDFNEFSNGGSTSEKTVEILDVYRNLEGSMLCLPTNSTGQIQLSSRDSKGVLSIPGFDSYSDLHLLLRARHYNHDKEVRSVSVGYILGETTNDFAAVELTREFTHAAVSLESVPSDARIILNNSGNQQYHRVIIDEISFIRGYSPAGVATNFVKSVFAAGSPARARGLSPSTEYIVTVSAFDADGNESRPSDPLHVETSDEGVPLSVRIR